MDDPAVYPWLMKTAGNKTNEYFRRKDKGNTVLYFDDISYEPSDDTDIYDKLITDEEIDEACQKLLSVLSSDERELYEAYFKNDMNYVEVAKKFGIDRNTASKRVRAIRKKLEDEAHKMFAIGGTVVIVRILSALFER